MVDDASYQSIVSQPHICLCYPHLPLLLLFMILNLDNLNNQGAECLILAVKVTGGELEKKQLLFLVPVFFSSLFPQHGSLWCVGYSVVLNVQ